MKNYFKITVAMVAIFTLVSCAKKTKATELEGTWEIRHVAGIQVAGVDPNFKVGNGNLLKFHDGNFEKHTDGALVDKGTFSLIPESESINNSQSNYALVLNDNEKVSILLADKKLVVFNGVIAADGTEITYEKQE